MLKQFLISLDQLINTLFGGMADETVSARCWRNQSKFVIVLDFILGKNHCYNSYISEVERKQFPKDYRE